MARSDRGARIGVVAGEARQTARVDDLEVGAGEYIVLADHFAVACLRLEVATWAGAGLAGLDRAALGQPFPEPAVEHRDIARRRSGGT